MRLSYYKTANRTAPCNVVWCGALLLAVWLCHFVGGFGAVCAVYAVWWTPLTTSMKCTAQHKLEQLTCSKQRHNQGNKYIKHHSIKPHKTQSNKLNKINQPMAKTPYITILNNNSQIKKSKAKNMKFIVRIRKPIPFSWRLRLEWWTNGGFSRVTQWVWEG